jgi:glycosyltransferase involved in cell wall biosynthesis
MTPVVPRVAIYSIEKVVKQFKTSNNLPWMADDFEVFYFDHNTPLSVLHRLKISVVITIGPKSVFKHLLHCQLPVFNFISIDDVTGDTIYKLYSDSVFQDVNPTVSIFTPAYNSFKKFDRALESVLGQSFKDWEWIILDDSHNDDNFNYIKNKVKHDHRIRLYRANNQDGMIGSTKRQVASLCNGKYLVELDHDDELHYMALDYIVAAFKKYPDAGFCYSNCCEIYEDGGHVRYPEGFAKGFGKHFDKSYKGRQLVGADTPINASTIRHIVGVPNHFRCWRSDVYFDIQRHNNKMAIVDDYELIVRTFLKTKFIHIPEILYMQYMNSGGNNTQESRRAEIQRMVQSVQEHYDKQIHDRIIELNGDDWLWNKEQNKSIDTNPPNVRETLSYVFKL